MGMYKLHGYINTSLELFFWMLSIYFFIIKLAYFCPIWHLLTTGTLEALPPEKYYQLCPQSKIHKWHESSDSAQCLYLFQVYV